MNILDFFGASYFLKAAVIAASVASFVAMAAIMNGVLGGIVATWPEWAQSAAYILPVNTGACVSANMTAVIAKWAYEWQRSHLMMVGNG